MDDGETAAQTAIRELKEETGYVAEEVLGISPILVADPGKRCTLSSFLLIWRPAIGMTNANMKLVALSVKCPNTLQTPEQKLDEGEFITVRVVELAKLHQTLLAYDEKV
jgi:ADP-ribose pyrophosphatase